MTQSEFLKHLQTITEPATLALAPGPLYIKVNQRDAMAAKLLIWLEEQMDDSTTVGDLLDTLACAVYWATFWASLNYDKDKEPMLP